jgi:hypothetical protein
MAADFLRFDLKQCRRGDVVEVTLNRGANVRLLDTNNFNKYRRGQKHTYYGGLAKRSPARVTIPRSGHWYVVVDMQGLRPARIQANVRTIPAELLRPLPAIREPRADIAEIARVLAQETGDQIGSFDVFISHAAEDKDTVVRPLAEALSEREVVVWYDEFALRVGDSLRSKIDAGIGMSRFGLVVLSPHFFSKGWTRYELDGLVTMSVSGKQGLLPLWHGVSKDEVMSYSPSLADKVALRTADSTIAEIADEIAAVVLERSG